MRVDLKKVLFVGSRESLNLFFECAQKIGHFQFVSVGKKKSHTTPKRLEDLKLAIKELKKLPVSHNQAAVSFFEVPNLIDRILILKREIENLHEEIRHVKSEIVKMHPLGHFNVCDLLNLEKETSRRFQFYFVRHDRYSKEEIPENLIFINREFDFDYYLNISNEEFHKSGFLEIPINRSLGDWEKELERLNKAMTEAEEEQKSMADYSDCLLDFLVKEMNEMNLTFSKEDVEYCLEDNLFSIDAWVPKNHIDQVKRLANKLPVIYQEVAIEKGEVVPTCLQNKGLGAVGQDLVEIYDTPSATEADPSKWVVWSFAIFFGMIISDAGYGLIFLLFSIFLWTKYPKMKKGLGRRMVKLITLLSLTSIVWGILIASYFSIKLEPNSTLNRYSILHYLAVNKIDFHIKEKDKTYATWMDHYPELQNSLNPETIIDVRKVSHDGKVKFAIMDQLYDSILMELALLVGIIHLSLSFMRNLRNHWAGIGWIAALWGGFMFFSFIIEAVPFFSYMGWMSTTTLKIVGRQLLYGGLGIAIILSVIQERLVGLASIFKVIEVFADTLSYLRLYALGLSSMVMAATFNEMGMEAGYVGGALIIFFGHTINMGLGTGAGVIHGLRLNLLEWYHHCYEGDGKKFKPLKLIIRD